MEINEEYIKTLCSTMNSIRKHVVHGNMVPYDLISRKVLKASNRNYTRNMGKLLNLLDGLYFYDGYSASIDSQADMKTKLHVGLCSVLFEFWGVDVDGLELGWWKHSAVLHRTSIFGVKPIYLNDDEERLDFAAALEKLIQARNPVSSYLGFRLKHL